MAGSRQSRGHRPRRAVSHAIEFHCGWALQICEAAISADCGTCVALALFRPKSSGHLNQDHKLRRLQPPDVVGRERPVVLRPRAERLAALTSGSGRGRDQSVVSHSHDCDLRLLAAASSRLWRQRHVRHANTQPGERMARARQPFVAAASLLTDPSQCDLPCNARPTAV